MAEFIKALAYQRAGGAVAPDVSQHVEFEDGGGSLKWVVALVILLSLLGVAGYQFGIVDEVLQRLDLASATTRTMPPPVEEEIRPAAAGDASGDDSSTGISDAPPLTQADGSKQSLPVSPPSEPGGSAGDSSVAPTLEEEALAETTIELIDLAELATPDVELDISAGSIGTQVRSVTLREDSPGVILDIIRREPLEEPLTLRLEEVGFSGNRSPWRSGQFEISNGGYVEFARGVERARVTLTMASDTRREADQQSTLRVREADSAAIALATIELTLEDDDQRRFETELPANTVAFAVSQVSVRERDPAVQIDLVRFNPDDTRLIVNTEVLDITATAGEDFFPPGNGIVVFGPGQRSARLLIPLVQDVESEGDEAFVVEFISDNPTREEGVHNRVAVMIRDDD